MGPVNREHHNNSRREQHRIRRRVRAGLHEPHPHRRAHAHGRLSPLPVQEQPSLFPHRRKSQNQHRLQRREDIPSSNSYSDCFCFAFGRRDTVGLNIGF